MVICCFTVFKTFEKDNLLAAHVPMFASPPAQASFPVPVNRAPVQPPPVEEKVELISASAALAEVAGMTATTMGSNNSATSAR